MALERGGFDAVLKDWVVAPTLRLLGRIERWDQAWVDYLTKPIDTEKLFREVGFPDGAINFIPGSGSKVRREVLKNAHLAGIHFTGSTATFQSMWKTVGDNIDKYKTYPRIVGETGGKDFVIAHTSADVDEVAVALIRGAFEYAKRFGYSKVTVIHKANVVRATDGLFLEMAKQVAGELMAVLALVIALHALRRRLNGARLGRIVAPFAASRDVHGGARLGDGVYAVAERRAGEHQLDAICLKVKHAVPHRRPPSGCSALLWRPVIGQPPGLCC